MKTHSLITAIFLLSLYSCSYNPTPYFEIPKPEIPLEDLPAYAYFKKGTYWIYKDSASGLEDSVYVYYDTVFQYHLGPGNWQKEGDYMQYEFHSHNFTDTYNYDYVIDMGYYGGGKVPVWREKFKPGDYAGKSFLMFNSFDPTVSLYAYTSPGVIKFKKYFDSISFYGRTFYGVTYFNDSQNASENFPSTYGSIDPTTDYYISKNVGIVKKKIYDTVFNTINKTDYLIRYHIVQ